MNDDAILLTERDYLRIRYLLSVNKQDDFEDLEVEIERARIISEDEIPDDLVTMNSKVTYQILNEGKIATIILVFPDEADIGNGKVSILASLGSALIGLRKNQEINWAFPDGRLKRLKILKVEKLS